MTLKIALDARLLTTSNTGDTQYWRGLLRGLLAQEGDFLLLLFSNMPRPKFIPDDPRFEWVEVGSIHPRVWSLVSFPLAARRAGAHVIHGQYNLSPLCGSRSISTIHDVSFFVNPGWFKPKDRILLQTQIPQTVRRVARVITVSETSRREIEEYIPAARGKVCVTYNALGENIQPRPRPLALTQVQDEFGLTTPFFMTTGTQWPRKNMQLAIDMANRWPAKLPHKFVICGKAGWGALGQNERVLFPGYVSDDHLSALLCAADAYICPSLHEGFGIPLLEAWACKTPVICGGGGGLSEVAGDAALVMPNYDPQAWVEGLCGLLADSGKLEAFRVAGTVRLSRFDWNVTATKTLAAYREVSSLK